MTGLEHFWKTLKDYGRLLTWSTGAALILPIAAYKARLDPPWPDGLIFATGVIQLVVMILTYQVAERMSRKKLHLLIILSASFWAVLSVIYLLMMSLLVFEVNPGGQRLIRGLACNNDALLEYGPDCPLLTVRQISRAEFDTQALWTLGSITEAKMLLSMLWLLAFMSLSALVGLFVISQGKRRLRGYGGMRQVER